MANAKAEANAMAKAKAKATAEGKCEGKMHMAKGKSRCKGKGTMISFATARSHVFMISWKNEGRTSRVAFEILKPPRTY